MRDGIIVYGHDYPLIRDALQACKEKGIPVITLVSDLANASRFCHVGINSYQAGRTAGLLMSQSMPVAGDVIMVSGRFDFSAYIQRIAGFRDTLTQRAPWLRLREVLAGEDERHKISTLLNQTLQQADIVGLYNSGDNNRDISVLFQQYKLNGRCCYITHDLYGRHAPAAGSRHAFLHAGPKRPPACCATDLLIRHLEQRLQPDMYQDGRWNCVS